METSNDNLASTFRTSGLTQEAFCKAHDITLERLRYYLYRKNRTKKSVKKAVLPAFVSFNSPSSTVVKNNQDQSGIVTIIRGNFTIEQITTLITNLG